mmetsp:Transcript_12028/g.34773  ORF Transcript_12028/g.34773 Transcript_12028/m.34773 type:complete len:243 (-) Transcript_12028:556-1284(-)
MDLEPPAGLAVVTIILELFWEGGPDCAQFHQVQALDGVLHVQVGHMDSGDEIFRGPGEPEHLLLPQPFHEPRRQTRVFERSKGGAPNIRWYKCAHELQCRRVQGCLSLVPGFSLGLFLGDEFGMVPHEAVPLVEFCLRGVQIAFSRHELTKRFLQRCLRLVKRDHLGDGLVTMGFQLLDEHGNVGLFLLQYGLELAPPLDLGFSRSWSRRTIISHSSVALVLNPLLVLIRRTESVLLLLLGQ